MATFEESLVYPLILLLAGGAISVGLGTWLAHWFESRRKEREFEVENHRKALEIRVEIVSKMSKAISYIFTKEYMNTDLKKQTLTVEEKKAIWENVGEYYNNVFVIRSRLQSYYLDTNLGKRWDDYSDVLDAVLDASVNYFISQDQHAKKEFEGDVQHAKEELEEDVKVIKDYLSDDKSINLDEITTVYDKNVWRHVVYQIRTRGDKIMKDALERPIKAF